MTEQTGTEREVVLRIEDMSVSYGRIQAIRNLSLTVRSGELVSLLGANGAGKSTTMRGLSGLRPLSTGRIEFLGTDITRMPAHKRVAMGVVQVPEGRRIFPGMTVVENLDMGCYGRKFESKAEYAQTRDRVFELFPRLAERRSQLGGTMSGGEQQMLAIGRAMMARPTLLLLDEPSMGLAPMVIAQIFDIIGEINAAGTTILLVEQNAHQALKRADRGYVLETGEITKSGTGAELLADDSIRNAYLGVA
ncbi:ABC transporter ATP-binding protein [uncultured Williamsia sp.]|uniref:ABC transporter ATP-binding protein n=1 Tax=uncultured Williamsia sp. TaxID=259311 RepID=UPI002610C873|nr:ABC transporter ATP-binding protein [uncultured Williamsia sp.]